MKTLKTVSRMWKLAAIIVLLLMVLLANVEAIKVVDLLNIQFANSYEEFKLIVTGKYQVMDVLYWNVYVDFLYIIAYTWLFLMSMRIFDLTLNLRISSVAYLICLLPGLLDAFENVFYLHLLNHISADSSNVFSAFFWLVRLKWGFIIPFIIMTLAIVLYYMTVWIKEFINLILTLLSFANK